MDGWECTSVPTAPSDVPFPPPTTDSNHNTTNDKQEKGLATQGPSAIKVATVDSFQGAEREVIVYSCVRTAGLGFLDSPHRCAPCLACVFAVH